MKAKQLLLSGFMIIPALITGCREIPSEVQEEISILNQQTDVSNKDDFQITYQTLNEIRESAKSLAERNTRIVQLKSEPLIPVGDSLSEYRILPVSLSESETEAHYSDIKHALDAHQHLSLPEPSWNHVTAPWTEIAVTDENGKPQVKDISEHNWTLYADSFCAERDDGSASLAVMQQYAVCNFWQDVTPPIYLTNLEIEKTVPVGFDDSLLSESFPMYNGEEWSLKDAKDFAEDFYNQYFSEWSAQVSFRVREIMVKKLPQGGYGYDFTLQEVYDSEIPLLPLYHLVNPNTIPGPETAVFGRVCTMWCLEPDRVQEISMQGIYQIDRTDTEIGKIVSAESALDIVSRSIAQEKTLKVYMELGFVGEISDSEFTRITGISNQADQLLLNGDFKSCKAVPYWFIREPIEGKRARISGNYYLVNALTGELSIL